MEGIKRLGWWMLIPTLVMLLVLLGSHLFGNDLASDLLWTDGQLALYRCGGQAICWYDGVEVSLLVNYNGTPLQIVSYLE